MREIKFRAKSGTQWRYGDLYHNECGDTMIYESQTVNGWRIKVDPETVGQFTGLLDVDGCEIYEGDVVRIDDWSSPSYIRWDDDTASFVVDRWTVNLAHVCYRKVIGNVHDNPDLLEVEHD